jgi:hypothetical protein
MNILYGIAFLVIIYYIFQWKKICSLMNKKLLEQNNKIDNKIQLRISEKINNDNSLIEGFIGKKNKIFNRVNSTEESIRNNCNSMFLENNYKGVYKNEINDDLFNYSSMKKEINL